MRRYLTSFSLPKCSPASSAIATRVYLGVSPLKGLGGCGVSFWWRACSSAKVSSWLPKMRSSFRKEAPSKEVYLCFCLKGDQQIKSQLKIRTKNLDPVRSEVFLGTQTAHTRHAKRVDDWVSAPFVLSMCCLQPSCKPSSILNQPQFPLQNPRNARPPEGHFAPRTRPEG